MILFVKRLIRFVSVVSAIVAFVQRFRAKATDRTAEARPLAGGRTA